MEFKKKTIIWEDNNVPPKNYLWVKSDNKVYEYSVSKNGWIESNTIQIKDSSSDSDDSPEYSPEETSPEVADAIQAYIDKQEAAGKPVSPTSTITVNYDEVPNEITLPETTHPVTLKGDFSENDSTTIQSNGEIEKVTINNTGAEANVIIDLPSTTATLTGNYNTVTVKAVADETLKVSTACKIKQLIVLKGTVVVNNALVEDNITSCVVSGGIVKANDEIEITSENASASKFTGTPAKVKLMEDVSVGNLAFGTFANGHYIWNLNGHSVEITRQGYGGTLIRGSQVILDIDGDGTFIQHGTTAAVWNSDKESIVNIHSGKFFAEEHSECIYAEKGTINIYGGEFHNNGTDNYLLNCKDANYKSGDAKIIVYGGKFYGFDPANCRSEGEGTNFVAEGYQSVNKGDYFEVEKI